MNALDVLNFEIKNAARNAVSIVSGDICDSMAARLTADGHVDTGALRDSIRAEIDTSNNGTLIESYIYADAESEDGVQYAEFIEKGTGAAHGREGGRVGTWRYKDREGNWHTTDGMDASPFIEPSVNQHIGRLGDVVTSCMYDLDKYGRRAAE